MTKYFTEIEENMDVNFLAKLDEAREYANIPFVINSAFRTVEHNKAVGGTSNSSHLKGLAVDISVTNSVTRGIVLEALIAVGFTRIGIAKTFIHVDLDFDKTQNVTWMY
jgi:zinc D-Ala-D-Ala carboxypeptidase